MRKIWCSQHKIKCGFGQDNTTMLILNKESNIIGFRYFRYEIYKHVYVRPYKRFTV